MFFNIRFESKQQVKKSLYKNKTLKCNMVSIYNYQLLLLNYISHLDILMVFNKITIYFIIN